MRKSALLSVILLGGLMISNRDSDAKPRVVSKTPKQSQKTNTFTVPELSTYYFCLLNRGPNWTTEDTPEHRRLQAEHVG